jgi:hypothetical protein
MWFGSFIFRLLLSLVCLAITITVSVGMIWVIFVIVPNRDLFDSYFRCLLWLYTVCFCASGCWHALRISVPSKRLESP